MKARYFFALYALLWLLCLCSCSRSPAPSAGGRAQTQFGENPAASLVAPENPNAGSKQAVTRKTVREFSNWPAWSQDAAARRLAASGSRDAENVAARSTPETAIVDAPAITREEITETATTELGTAHRDESRTVAAKLASFRPVQFLGVALMLAAAAMFHPVARKAVGAGKEMQFACAGIGAALVFGPSLIVGHEGLIIGAGLVALAVAWLWSRLAYKSGELDALK